MTPEELVEAVSKMTPGEIVWHRNHAVRLLQSLISERDAALARVAELEKDAGRYRWLRNCDDSHGIVQRHLHTGNSWLPGGADLDAAIDAAISNAAPNVRDAGPTPYSGRTTRRDEG